jgi:iron complex outermembrane receptor protein
MLSSKLMRGVSASALFALFSSSLAEAQQPLPTIDVGGARRAAGQAIRGTAGVGRQGAAQTTSPASTEPAQPGSELADRGGPKDPTAYHVVNASSATKTNTPIMQTPMNVQVVPRQVISDQQSVVIEEATRNVSNVFAAPYVGLQGGWLIRGFLEYAYYQDGVRVNPWAAIPPRDTVDVQQVEVVKGPASTLYGRMQPGGLVEVTTKMPDAEARYEVQQMIGSYNSYRTTFNATGPASSDKSLLYRVDGAYQIANSFRDGLHNRHVYLAPKLFWRPTEDTSLVAYLNFYGGRDAIDTGIPSLIYPNNLKFLNGVAPVPRTRNFGSTDTSLNTKSDVRIGYRFWHAFNKDWDITHRLDLNFRDVPEPWVDVFNPDAANCTVISCPLFRDALLLKTKEQNYFTSIELRGRFDTLFASHTLLVGADGYVANDYVPFDLNFTLVPSTDLFHPPYPTNLMQFASAPDITGVLGEKQSWYGVYLQDQIKLPFNFHLLAGFRYDSARVSSPGFTTFYPSYSDDSSSGAADALKPRVGLLWQPLPQLSLYGNYVEGFGLSAGVGVNRKVLPPEEARQWEGGAKISLFDDRLTATAAWFHIVKTNVRSPAGPGGIVFSETTGAVRNTGVEFDIQGQVTPELKIIGSFASIDSKIISEINGARVGNRWWGVPRNSGSFWAVYEPAFEQLRGFAIGAGFTARGAVEVDRANSYQLPAYAIANLMARYSFEYQKKKLTAQLNIDNIFDKTYYVTPGWTSGIIPGAPQTFRGSLKMEF